MYLDLAAAAAAAPRAAAVAAAGLPWHPAFAGCHGSPATPFSLMVLFKKYNVKLNKIFN